MERTPRTSFAPICFNASYQFILLSVHTLPHFRFNALWLVYYYQFVSFLVGIFFFIYTISMYAHFFMKTTRA